MAKVISLHSAARPRITKSVLSVYRRERVLELIPGFKPHEKLPVWTMLELLGERHTLLVVLRVRRMLKEKKRVVVARGEARSHLYDINQHVTIAHAFNQETLLARSLVRKYFALRAAA